MKDDELRAEIRCGVKILPVQLRRLPRALLIRGEEKHIFIPGCERMKRRHRRPGVLTMPPYQSEIRLLQLRKAVHEYLDVPETERRAALHRVERLLRVETGARQTYA